MYHFSRGEFLEAIAWVINDYVGYGLIWFLIGITIVGVSYQKNRSWGIAGFVFSMFTAMIVEHLPVEIQAYFTLVVGVMLFGVIYRIIK